MTNKELRAEYEEHGIRLAECCGTCTHWSKTEGGVWGGCSARSQLRTHRYLKCWAHDFDPSKIQLKEAPSA